MTNHSMVYDRRKPILTQQPPLELHRESAPYSVEYSYYNCTGSTIILSERTGLRLVLRNETNPAVSGLTVKVVYKFSQDIAEKLINQLANIDCDVDHPMHVFKSGLVDRPYKIGHRHAVIVDYHVRRSEFGSKGGSVYISDTDTLLTMVDDVNQAPMHPYSEDYKRFMRGAETNSGALVLKLEIVDNTKTISARYANINGDVYKIVPIVDLDRANGLYKYSKKAHPESVRDHASYETYYSFDEMTKAGVFDTIDEAIYNGDLSIKKKEDVQNAEHLALLQKIESDRAKHASTVAAAQQKIESDRAKHDQDIEMLRLKHQENLQALKEEHKRLQMKDYYDERGYDRKDSSEFMKHLPIIILGAGAALAAFMGLSA